MSPTAVTYRQRLKTRAAVASHDYCQLLLPHISFVLYFRADKCRHDFRRLSRRRQARNKDIEKVYFFHFQYDAESPFCQEADAHFDRDSRRAAIVE